MITYITYIQELQTYSTNTWPRNIYYKLFSAEHCYLSCGGLKLRRSPRTGRGESRGLQRPRARTYASRSFSVIEILLSYVWL